MCVAVRLVFLRNRRNEWEHFLLQPCRVGQCKRTVVGYAGADSLRNFRGKENLCCEQVTAASDRETSSTRNADLKLYLVKWCCPQLGESVFHFFDEKIRRGIASRQLLLCFFVSAWAIRKHVSPCRPKNICLRRR